MHYSGNLGHLKYKAVVTKVTMRIPCKWIFQKRKIEAKIERKDERVGEKEEVAEKGEKEPKRPAVPFNFRFLPKEDNNPQDIKGSF